MDFYKSLNISENATQAEIKTAYRKLALIHHPDKQGDPRKFKEINNAYTVLSDPTARSNYDCFGDNPPDFDEQSNSYIIKIKLTLEQIFLGYSHMQKIVAKSVCPDCIMFMETCVDCSGSGQIVQMMNVGPFMQQMRAKCKSCFMGQKKKEGVDICCKKCNGTCIIMNAKKVELKFQPGILDLTKRMQFGDQNYIITASIEEHEIYSLGQSGELKTTINIGLGESLTETFYKKLKFLDGEHLVIAPDFIVMPNDKYVIRGKGLNRRADLIISFNVVFPERFTDKRKEYLKKIFGIIGNNEGIPLDKKANLIKYVGIDCDGIPGMSGMSGMSGIPGIPGMPGMPSGVHVQNCAQQ